MFEKLITHVSKYHWLIISLSGLKDFLRKLFPKKYGWTFVEDDPSENLKDFLRKLFPKKYGWTFVEDDPSENSVSSGHLNTV